MLDCWLHRISAALLIVDLFQVDFPWVFVDPAHERNSDSVNHVLFLLFTTRLGLHNTELFEKLFLKGARLCWYKVVQDGPSNHTQAMRKIWTRHSIIRIVSD